MQCRKVKETRCSGSNSKVQCDAACKGKTKKSSEVNCASKQQISHSKAQTAQTVNAATEADVGKKTDLFQTIRQIKCNQSIRIHSHYLLYSIEYGINDNNNKVCSKFVVLAAV